MNEQDLLDQLEVCCPVCGSSSFSYDETNGLSCDECDYADPENELVLSGINPATILERGEGKYRC